MEIEKWARPDEWEEYPEKEDQIWEINHFKTLCLFLGQKTGYEFEISFEDKTCIFVTVKENDKAKAECFVNRGNTEEPIFSIYSEEGDNEFHGSSIEDVFRFIVSSQGYLKEQE